MIAEADNVEFEIVELSDPFAEHRSDIELFWTEYCRRNPGSYSEKVLNVFNVERTEQGFKLYISFANFYEVLYSKTIGNIKTRNLFSGGYIRTSDGYFCLAVDRNNEINLIGGVASLEDFDDGRFIPDLCLIRECKEEMGIDISDNHFSYALKYLKITSDDEPYFPVGLLYEINTTYSKLELENLFAGNSHDNELLKLKWLRLDNKEAMELNIRRQYIKELFDLIRRKET